MRKIFFFFFLFVILIALGLFIYRFFLERKETGALQVTASPKSKVYLNGEYLGTTPLCRCPQSDITEEGSQNEMLPVGEYTLRLVPEKNEFSEFQEKIAIEKSVLTVVDRKFAQGASSEAVVILLTSLEDQKGNELVVVSSPDKADVLLDDSLKGQTPLILKNITPSDHTLTIRKDGYKEKTIRIRATDGYKLVARGYLGIDPQAIAGIQAVASSSGTPTPSLGVTRVRILETDTGFLRVRDANSLGGREIDQVSPDEEYPLLDEQPGWYQIELEGGEKGWVSSQYAEKIE